MPRVSKQEAGKLLANVPKEYVFWCCDGSVFRNMKELEQALASMTDETFACHSNEQKKDFSKWVQDVIGDKELAKDLGKSLNRTQAANVVAKRIAFLQGKLA